MPMIETTYLPSELKKGKCKSCGENSNEILIKDGRCVDCIREQAFFEMTMEDNSEDEDEF